MQAEEVAVCGFNRVGRPKLFAQNTVEMVFAVVAIQLIRRAVEGEASLRDAIMELKGEKKSNGTRSAGLPFE